MQVREVKPVEFVEHGVRRYLARRGVQVGLSSLARMLGAFAQVHTNAGLGGSASAVLREALGPELHEKLLENRRIEVDRYRQQVTN